MVDSESVLVNVGDQLSILLEPHFQEALKLHNYED
jgi:hypothetical protein